MVEDYYYKKNVVSILIGGEGCREEYSSVCEFKHHLKEVGLIEEELKDGWVFGRDGQQLDLYANNTHKITALLKHMSSTPDALGVYCLIQFWAAVEIEGGHHYLSTSNQPFWVSLLTKGALGYRNLSMGHVYGVGVEADADADADAEQLGSVGRAYRNKQPESTPDLRLYSTIEFPLRDHAARCGFSAYLALPLFDFHCQNQNQCCGVLEILSAHYIFGYEGIASALDEGLKKAGLRSTHFPLYRDLTNTQQVEDDEITEILELGIKAIPQLSLAQVWVPCKRCLNSFCFERASFIESRNKILNIIDETDFEMHEYIEACMLHNSHIDYSRLGEDLYDVSFSKNPLARYAERARFSNSFAISLQSVNNNTSNHLYVMEFFVQPNYRDGDSPLHLLSNILETKLKSFKCVLGRRLLEELVVQSRQHLILNAFELESIDMLKAMDPCMEKVSESNFMKFLETDEICLIRSFFENSASDGDSILGWLFCSPIEGKSSENSFDNHSLRVPEILMKEKIQQFMIEMASNFGRTYCMVQFWAPTMVQNRRCLKTLDQPYALRRLAKGVASFRNKCTKHHYFVDEEAKEDELGPVGRVFKNGYPELLYDIHSTSTKEFSMRNYGIHCGFESYFALPVFDHEHQQFKKNNCVGVLEFIGYKWYNWNEYVVDRDLKDISRALEEQNLFCDIHSNLEANVHNEEAMDEINNALSLINKIPQCYWAKVWVQNEKMYDE